MRGIILAASIIILSCCQFMIKTMIVDNPDVWKDKLEIINVETVMNGYGDSMDVKYKIYYKEKCRQSK